MAMPWAQRMIACVLRSAEFRRILSRIPIFRISDYHELERGKAGCSAKDASGNYDIVALSSG
jgi:hypothetical protein